MFLCLVLFCIAIHGCTSRKQQIVEQMKKQENETFTICAADRRGSMTRMRFTPYLPMSAPILASLFVPEPVASGAVKHVPWSRMLMLPLLLLLLCTARDSLFFPPLLTRPLQPNRRLEIRSPPSFYQGNEATILAREMAAYAM